MIRYGKRLNKKSPLDACRGCDARDRLLDHIEAMIQEDAEYYDDDVDAKTEEVMELKGQVARLKHLVRLHQQSAAYDKDAVAGFSSDTARILADMASDVLESGGKVSFAAACAVSLARKMKHEPQAAFYLGEFSLGNWIVTAIQERSIENRSFRCADDDDADFDLP